MQAPDLADYVPCPDRRHLGAGWSTSGGTSRDGQLLGRLHDFADHASAPIEITAHRAGVVIAMHFGAVCRRGATLYVIAQDVAAGP